MKKKWKIETAWVWAGQPPPLEVQRRFKLEGGYSGTPGLVDLEVALENGAKPIAYIPSTSAFGGYLLLRTRVR